MKLLLAGMLLVSPLVCSKRYPDHANIICDRADCKTYMTHNNLTIRFEFLESYYHYFLDRSAIGIQCHVENNTNYTLLFDRRNFSIRSNKQEYVLEPYGELTKRGSVENWQDQLRVTPGQFRYNFEFRSKSKMSEKEYNKLIAADTISFEYSGNDHKDLIFRMTGIPR